MTVFILQIFIAIAAANELPSAHAFVGWSDDTDKAAIRIEQVAAIEIKCDDRTLFPSHPQSHLKEYHEIKYGIYDHAKMTKADEACAIAGFDRNRRCLRPKILHSLILSDVYNDACGNFYRGFWRVEFFDTDESMGSLASRGRTFYEDSRAEFPGTFRDGQTYSVPEFEFIKVSRPFAGDVDNARKYRSEAIRNGFVFKANLFTPKE